MLTIFDLLGPDFFTVQDISPAAVVFNILSVFLLSLIILFTYKKSYQTTVYNRSFAISLPISAMVTSVIIISVSSNIILSLGMVGALSIVRFRTALKNPFDTVFMFWAIGLGVTSGAGLTIIALISTIVISAAIFILIALELLESSYFLIIRASSKEDEEEIMKKVEDIYGRYTLRNKTIKDTGLDLTLEIRGKDKKYSEINQIKDIKSVKSVVLLSHQGDYISE
ncbi:MAG: DUF4956 domain-containing protein [Firmicutes bacterium]|nr:DUF4956 domain-containing protein [Bacillota bacterium]